MAQVSVIAEQVFQLKNAALIIRSCLRFFFLVTGRSFLWSHSCVALHSSVNPFAPLALNTTILIIFKQIFLPVQSDHTWIDCWYRSFHRSYLAYYRILYLLHLPCLLMQIQQFCFLLFSAWLNIMSFCTFLIL